MNKQNNILPYCIYHKYDDSTNSYYGYIGNSTLNKSAKYTCPKSRNWQSQGTFYAIDPSVRPIPPGMQLYCIKRNKGFPYDSIHFDIDYDFFFVKNDCVYFMTYSSVNPFTVPLYLYQFNNHIFPSFNKTPPKSNQNWVEIELSPIYVMTEKSVGNINIEDVKFKCINAACMPWVKPIKDVYQFEENDKVFNIADCVMYCTEINSHRGVNPSNLKNNLKILEEKNDVKMSQIISYDEEKKIKYKYILLGFLILSLFVFFIVLMLKPEEKKVFNEEFINNM
jgi:hypothetical protein